MPPQAPPQKEGMTLDQKYNVVMNLGDFASKPAEAFLRVPGTAGCRHFAGAAAIGLFAMFLTIAQWNPDHAPAAFWATVAMLLAHRMKGSPAGEHSQYNGYPWLSQLFGVPERAAKNLEVFLVLALGVCLMDYSQGIGTWLLISGAGLALNQIHITMRNKAIDIARSDAIAYQQITMQRWTAHAAPHVETPRKARRKGIAVLVLLAGGSWLIYSGNVELPRFIKVLTGRHVQVEQNAFSNRQFYNQGTSYGNSQRRVQRR